MQETVKAESVKRSADWQEDESNSTLKGTTFEWHLTIAWGTQPTSI